MRAAARSAAAHHEIDTRREVYDRFVRHLIRGNVLRGEICPLSVAAERTRQAISVAAAARTLGADAVAHGSTGAGNDQFRFDVAFRVLAPDLPQSPRRTARRPTSRRSSPAGPGRRPS